MLMYVRVVTQILLSNTHPAALVFLSQLLFSYHILSWSRLSPGSLHNALGRNLQLLSLH